MPVSDEARELHRSSVVFDLHCHPTLPWYLFGRKFYGGNNTSHRDFAPERLLNQMSTDYDRLREGNVDAICSTVYVPEVRMLDTCAPLHALRLLIPRFKAILKKDPFENAFFILGQLEAHIANSVKKGAQVAIARDYATLLSTIAAGRIAIVHALEGAHMLGLGLASEQTYLDRVDALAARGCAYMTLAHFFPNDVALPVNGFAPELLQTGCFRQEHHPERGLTDIGKAVVRRMLDVGIIVDLTHATPAARRDVFTINKEKGAPQRPIVFTHVGVRALGPRELMGPDDAELHLVRETNGVVGVIAMNHWLDGTDDPKNGLRRIVETMKHIRRTIGIDHVAIGTDFDGFTDPCDDFYDSSMMPSLTQALLHDGTFTHDEIRKILGGNVLRVLRDGWGKRATVASAETRRNEQPADA
jgi:microsomal dipeptidase-like Zn-dependent dipeptidase